MKISVSNYNKLIPETFHSFSKLRKKRRTTKFRDKVSKQETGGAIKRFLPPRCPHGSFPLPRLPAPLGSAVVHGGQVGTGPGLYTGS